MQDTNLCCITIYQNLINSDTDKYIYLSKDILCVHRRCKQMKTGVHHKSSGYLDQVNLFSSLKIHCLTANTTCF